MASQRFTLEIVAKNVEQSQDADNVVLGKNPHDIIQSHGESFPLINIPPNYHELSATNVENINFTVDMCERI